jgi:DNA polymerase-3 subunit gamma/tau
MYQVLYRKWRPKVFDDVIGQNHVITTLKNEIISKKTAHAYLFIGSRGTGKTSCAKILAKALNCLNLKCGNPCCECKICLGIDSGNILDVSEIDAASNNGVENIRKIREEVMFAACNTKYRIYIIDEVHMLSIGAFNALLKILEEPPKHVVFILATTEAHKIPFTIISRCQKFNFNRISFEEISNKIKHICKCENVEIDDSAANLIAKTSDGAVRDALSILDQCINQSEKKIVTEIEVVELLGISGKENVIKFAEHIFEENISKILELIENLYAKSKNMYKLCEEILDFFKTVMIFKSIGVIEQNYSEYSEFIRNIPPKYDLSVILNYVENFKNAILNMNKGADKRLELETTLIKLCKTANSPIKNDENLVFLKEKIDKLENIVKSLQKSCSHDGNFEHYENNHLSENLNFDTFNDNSFADTDNNVLLTNTIQKNEKNVVVNSEYKNQQNNASKEIDISKLYEKTEIFEEWKNVLGDLSKKSKMLYQIFQNSFAYTSNDYILVDAKNKLIFDFLKNPVYREYLRGSIKKVTGKIYKLGPYIKNSKNPENTCDLPPNNVTEKKIKTE